MKTKHLRITIGTITGLILCVMFQNGSPVKWDNGKIKKVDLKARNHHAKELLGRDYKRSPARFHEQNPNLAKVLLSNVKERLPKDYLPQAAALTRTIIEESRSHGLDPVFVMAVIATESSFNPLALGGVGEIGLMQIRPETAEWIAEKQGIPWIGSAGLKNPVINVKIGVAYMSWLRSQMGPESEKYVTAYNMGPNALRRLMAKNVKPAEYRSRVIANYETIYKQLPETSLGTKTAQL